MHYKIFRGMGTTADITGWPAIFLIALAVIHISVAAMMKASVIIKQFINAA